jgi:PTH1 family peptidyl-tRNA hydrolase
MVPKAQNLRHFLLGSENFWRLRLGIGHPKTIETPIKNVSDFVLSEPSGEEKKKHRFRY